MSGRSNIFVIHSWDESDNYERAKSLLTAKESGLADYSVPSWRPIVGSDDRVAESLRARILAASAVIVLNTDGLHKRPFSSMEMAMAAGLDKRIIVLQPHGDFRQPIPAALDGHVYRVVPWRSDVLGRAIRSEYPYDKRIFDVAEQADRRLIVKILAATAGAISLILLVRSVADYYQLDRELRGRGIYTTNGSFSSKTVACAGLVGAIVAGGITALITEDKESTLWAAVSGSIAGAAIGAAMQYQAILYGTQEIRVLTSVPPFGASSSGNFTPSLG